MKTNKERLVLVIDHGKYSYRLMVEEEFKQLSNCANFKIFDLESLYLEERSVFDMYGKPIYHYIEDDLLPAFRHITLEEESGIKQKIMNLEEYLSSINISYEIKLIENRKIDKYHHDIYLLTLSRGSVKCSFEFYQSVSNSLRYKDKSFPDRFYTPGGISLGDHKSVSERNVKELCFSKGYRNPPKIEDIFQCLTKHSPGMFEEFCDEFGYDDKLITSLNTYKKVVEEYIKLTYFFVGKEVEDINNILSNQD